MKFFHISDLHLGKRVCGFSMLEDQRYILRQIVDLAGKHRPDGILIAGDLYDKSMP
ncbi:MAG: metallophosphoesterase, partial [Candidatus Choladocola sp.]|nr:metallophosphoesterase [Candidatus Choladocola sp.]